MTVEAGMTKDELNKARRRFKMDYLDRLSTNLGRSLFLVDAVLSGRGLESLDSELTRVLSVTPQALAAFSSKYFVPQNRVVLEFGPQ